MELGSWQDSPRILVNSSVGPLTDVSTFVNLSRQLVPLLSDAWKIWSKAMVYHYEGEVRIMKLEVGNYGNNCYIIIDPETNESAIIDTPAEPDRILEAVRGTRVRYILITHRHSDHLGAFQEVLQATGGRVGIHPEEADALPNPPDFMLSDGDTLQVGTVPLRVIHTPGHTLGSCCFVTGNHIFTGDTLFPGGPGRSRGPDELLQEIESITQRLYTLPSKTNVYPGHGADTTIGASREEYAIFAAKRHPPDLHGDVVWLES